MFDKVNYGENFLILFSKTNNHKQIFRNFMRQSNGDSIFVYISHKTNQINFSFNVRNFSFNVLTEEVIHELKNYLDKCFEEMERDNRKMLLVADWSKVNLNNNKIFIPFLEGLTKKSQGLLTSGWKRKYRTIAQKIPMTLVNAFETTSLDEVFIDHVVKLHHRVYLLEENTNTFLLPTIHPYRETIFPKFNVVEQKALEKLAKDNLELIALLLLEDNDKSGYQILKEIASHFHCILSQGTVYPLLYQLEKQNKIIKKTGRGREVIYSLTPETKEALKTKKEECLRSYQHLASFFEK